MEKSLQVIIKQSALNDLEEQFIFYAENYSVQYAEKFRNQFFEKAKILALQPQQYPECRFLPTKNKTYRNVIWGNYLIIFKIKKDSLDILVLHHTKRNPKRIKSARRIK